MDNTTMVLSLGIMGGMPDNAASSAAAAAESAAEVRDLIDAVDTATVEETLAYLDLDGDAQPAEVVPVSGKNPVIKGARNTMYVCGELNTLTFTPPPSGICAIRFSSGTTATVLSVPNTVRWPEWFSGTLEANRVYEINVMDGVYGAVMSWA